MSSSGGANDCYSRSYQIQTSILLSFTSGEDYVRSNPQLSAGDGKNGRMRSADTHLSLPMASTESNTLTSYNTTTTGVHSPHSAFFAHSRCRSWSGTSGVNWGPPSSGCRDTDHRFSVSPARLGKEGPPRWTKTGRSSCGTRGETPP